MVLISVIRKTLLGSVLCAFGSIAYSQEQNCPIPIGESATIAESKQAFACRQFQDVVRSLRDWNAEDPKERFDRLSLYIAALANTGRHAETLVTVRYALRFVRLEQEQLNKLQQMVQVVADAVPKATEDELFLAVLADPQNTELNFRLALAQTAMGNMKGLSATLSRILLYDEDNYLAKDMLFQLNISRGNLPEAEADLRRIVADPTIPEQEKVRSQQLLDQLSDLRSPHSWTKIFGYTWGLARNPLSISESGQSVVGAFPGVLFDAGVPVTEHYEQSLLGLNYQYSLPYQDPQAITAGLTLINKDFQTQAALRMKIAVLSLGYNWIATGDSVSFNITDVDLGRSSLSQTYKLGGVKMFARTQKGSFSGTADITNSKFQAPAQRDKNGNTYGFGLNGSYDPFGGRVIFAPSLAYNWTDARTAQDSTDIFSYSMVTSVPLNNQWTGSLTLKETETDRDGPDTSVSDVTRKDWAFNYTLSLSWRKPGPPNKLVPSVTITHSETDADSTVLNFKTKSRDTNIAMTWVF